jgi:Endonuclease/Exonuclease/phosphatase family
MPGITVMTWNIQNLFPVGHADGPVTQQDYYAKIAGLAEVINAVEPDLLALQEVGPKQVLADLNAACSIDFDNRLVGIPDGRGIRVALLSPRLLSNRVDITTFPWESCQFSPAIWSLTTRPPQRTRPYPRSDAVSYRPQCAPEMSGSR